MEIIGLLTEEPLAKLALKNKIKSFITPDLYRDLDDFIKDNPTFEDFKKRAKFNYSFKRALNLDTHDITEEDYQQILADLKQELEEKMKIEKDKISTVQVKGKEIATYTNSDGSVITVDNSYTDKSISEQLDELQQKYSRFRQNSKTNTDELMEHVQEEIKPEPSFQTVATISDDSLSGNDSEMARVAQEYQATVNNEVSVNLDEGLILDSGNVLSIEESDNGYAVVAPEQSSEVVENTPVKAKQKTLRKQNLKQAGFSDVIMLALLSGALLALIIVNIYL